MGTLATHLALIKYLRAAENRFEPKKGANIAELQAALDVAQKGYWSALDADDRGEAA